MNATWGNREQSTDRHQDRDTGLRAEHAYLLLAVFSISAATVLYIVDFQFERFEVNRGAYAILTAFFVAGCCGWLSRSAERRMRRVAVGELQRLASALEDLSQQVASQRVLYVSAQGQQSERAWVPQREEILDIVSEEIQKTVESVRSQAYAEGYVDGVARRPDDDTSPN